MIAAMGSEQPARRMTSEEVRAYWRAHEEQFGDIDYDADPEGLSGYLGPAQPAWMNVRHAAAQRRAFDRLLSRVPSPAPGARALDIGCGSARWTRRLGDAGYRAVGIDLQDSVIETNRRRFPDLEFHALAVQDLPPGEPFDVVSSVGVLQHIPYEEQGAVLSRLREVTVVGGHAIVLETVDHDAPNTFPHDRAGWQRAFREAGWEPLDALPYVYHPVRRALGRARRMVTRRRPAAPLLPTQASRQNAGRPGLRLAVTVDGMLEPVLQRVRPPLRAKWCAFLFRAG